MLIKSMREGMESERTEEREAARIERAFLYGESKMSPSVMPRPIGMPRCVAESRRGRSGHGQEASSSLRRGMERGGPEEITQLLSLLTPSPESSEKRLMRVRAGEIRGTVREANAMSSA